ncbi:copper metallochaperone bacterial analog of Cox17 protein [Vibrio sp. RC586]|uniref:copper chaperone PCu(A)C n=1 Tax=Vibrio sp. RC586 TaxID=675815 RepID=UPI0001BB7F59|nr:copper chaperone PCu(A)C [Vibrio sp. RC586]EEY99817.1 copper metallochaperone bacterial analog of Cox17 protein [Vibrio sp. RC586]
MKLKTLLLSSLLLSSSAFAKSDIMIHAPYARATPPAAVNSALFAEVMNRSDLDRYIVSASTDVAGKVELHDVIKEGDVMKMRQVEELVVPAKGTLVLQPGSFHIMLLELKKPLQEGESIEVEFTFKNGEKQTVTAPVKKVMSGMAQHGSH